MKSKQSRAAGQPALEKQEDAWRKQFVAAATHDPWSWNGGMGEEHQLPSLYSQVGTAVWVIVQVDEPDILEEVVILEPVIEVEVDDDLLDELDGGQDDELLAGLLEEVEDVEVEVEVEELAGPEEVEDLEVEVKELVGLEEVEEPDELADDDVEELADDDALDELLDEEVDEEADGEVDDEADEEVDEEADEELEDVEDVEVEVEDVGVEVEVEDVDEAVDIDDEVLEDEDDVVLEDEDDEVLEDDDDEVLEDMEEDCDGGG
jgi:hypothetical protein